MTSETQNGLDNIRDLGEYLTAAIARKGLTVDRVAARVPGLATSTLHQWLTGTRPDDASLEKLAGVGRVLDLPEGSCESRRGPAKRRGRPWRVDKEGRWQAALLVAQRRKALGMTVPELARAAELDPRVISGLESGRSWPPDYGRRKIETALRLRPGHLDRPISEQSVLATDDLAVDPKNAPNGVSATIGLGATLDGLCELHSAATLRGDQISASQLQISIDYVRSMLASPPAGQASDDE